MYELFVLRQTVCIEVFLYEIFHSLHIVVCSLFDVFYLFGIFSSEIPVQVAQKFVFAAVEIFQLRNGIFCKFDEIFNFDPNAVSNKCVFRKIFSKFLCLRIVASVYRTYSHESVV